MMLMMLNICSHLKEDLPFTFAFFLCLFLILYLHLFGILYLHFYIILIIFYICRHFKEDFEQAIVQLSEPLIDASLDLYK